MCKINNKESQKPKPEERKTPIFKTKTGGYPFCPCNTLCANTFQAPQLELT